MQSKVTLKGNMFFEGELGGYKIPLDAAPEFGGENKGPGPKGLLLTGLAGCTGMDVISILRKMKSEPEEFAIEVETTLTDEHPRIFKDILVIYYFKGKNVTPEKAKKAIELSLQKYCGVSAMLAKNSRIDYQINIKE